MRLGSLVVVMLAAVIGAAPASAQRSRPDVAILVYDGVQVDDHTVPFEVLSQYGLNNVYTVAKEPRELASWRGMRILPNYAFADAPEPDVLVLPGGDAREALDDPEIMEWVRRKAASADIVLTVCTGTFFLVGTDLLDGARVTTWYERQDELARLAPEAEVVGDVIVVESGKLVTAAGSGIEGSLRVFARLHGEAWAEAVALGMEHEPVPPAAHVPRVELADLNLPDGIYGAFPWREAEFLTYAGDRDEWRTAWRFESETPLDSLSDRLARAVVEEDGWKRVHEDRSGDRWESIWVVAGHDGRPWRGVMTLLEKDDTYRLDVRVVSSGDGDVSAASSPEPCESVDPSWSPDGATIVFASNCEGGDLDLWGMDPDGGNVVRLSRTPGDEHGPVLSPDGSRLAYAYKAEGEDSEVWTMAPDGSDARPVTENDHTDWDPTWAPDGRRIVWESRRDGNVDLWVVDVETGEETRLTDHPERDLSPAWSPDGSTIAFQSDRDGRYGIYGVSPEGSEVRRLVDLPGDAVGPDWSPDGRRLVFSYYAGGDGDLWIASLDGGDPVPLIRGDRTDFAPAWSPDGRTIAFIRRGEGEAWDIWTIGADGTGKRRLTSGGGGRGGPGREEPFQP